MVSFLCYDCRTTSCLEAVLHCFRQAQLYLSIIATMTYMVDIMQSISGYLEYKNKEMTLEE